MLQYLWVSSCGTRTKTLASIYANKDKQHLTKCIANWARRKERQERREFWRQNCLQSCTTRAQTWPPPSLLHKGRGILFIRPALPQGEPRGHNSCPLKAPATEIKFSLEEPGLLFAISCLSGNQSFPKPASTLTAQSRFSQDPKHSRSPLRLIIWPLDSPPLTSQFRLWGWRKQWGAKGRHEFF